MYEHFIRGVFHLDLHIYATIASIASKAVSREERAAELLTHVNLAILRLKWRQNIGRALGFITALASIYLFSVLGVNGMPNENVYVNGLVGLAIQMIAVLIEFFVLAFGG